MITLSKVGNAIKFTFDENDHYLNDGTIEVPVNSLSLVMDDSDMVTFKKSASNDIFVSATYDELGMTKAELEQWYKTNMVDTGGGGGGTGGTTPQEVQSMIDASLIPYSTTSEIDGMIDEAVSGKADSSIVDTLDGVVTAHTADTAIHVTASEKAAWDAKSDFSGSYNDLTDKLSAGTNITIIDNVISAESGDGKPVEGGRGITVTSGDTANTVSISLPISAGTGSNSIQEGNVTVASGNYGAHAEGGSTSAIGDSSHAEGSETVANGHASHAEGTNTITNNRSEHASGQYNVSHKANNTFGDSGNTLFSVGNGTPSGSRHNAFEIRQNGDIYISKDGSDIKLQDNIGVSAYTAGTGIDITNNIISVTGKVNTSDFETYSGNVDTALNGKQDVGDYVTGARMSAYTYDKDTIDEKVAQGGTFDPTQYYTTAQTYSKTETDGLLDEKLDATAYTPTDLSNYDTKLEVDTKIEQATSGKANTSDVVTDVNGYGYLGSTPIVGIAVAKNGANTPKALFNVGTNLTLVKELNTYNLDVNTTNIATKSDLNSKQNTLTAGTGIGITNDVISVTGKVDTSTYETYTAATATEIGNKLATSDFNTYSGTVDTAIASKASQSTVDTLNGVVTAHTANTNVHVTSAEKNTWNSKSDFSGDYNDLTNKPTIPTVPTSNTAFTNDAGYITSDAISGKADTSAVTAAIDAAVSGKADTSDILVTDRNSIKSVIKEAVYSLSTDDVYTIVGTKANATNILSGLIIVDGVSYIFSGSTSSDVYVSSTLDGVVAFDLSTNFSISLVNRDANKIDELFIESFTSSGEESPMSNITITHNPSVGVNKIDYIASLYTEFVHEKYALADDVEENKQDKLVSGTNIKTINNQSILGSGNITIQGGSGAEVIEITQAQYDAAQQAGTLDLTALYVITDAIEITVTTAVTQNSTAVVTSGGVYNALGGLKLQQITQSAYDALSPNYNANTLYVIVN